MDPGLQSAFLAEASAPLILLGAGILLYRSFRERYLLPWIAGWAVYALAKVFLALSSPHQPGFWLALANLAFVGAVTLFSSAIFSYVYRPRLLVRLSIIIFPAFFLAVLQALLPSHANVVLFFFFPVFWRLIAWVAAWQLIVFSKGRGNSGAWILSFSLLLLCQYHPSVAYGILNDVLMGIGMMMILLDESRAQNGRLDILNRLSRIVSSQDELRAIVDTVLDELIKVSGAQSAWFRVLEENKLRIAAQRGLPQEVADAIRDLEVEGSTTGRLLERGEVGAVQRQNMVPLLGTVLVRHGIDHIVVVPVLGKTSRIGAVVLGMDRPRSYTDDDRDFLKAAANQLGLAAENRSLVQQLLRSVRDLRETRAAEERYKILFDHMQEGVFVSSPDGRILDCNQALVEMMGYSGKEELSQVNLNETFYPDPEDRRKFLSQMETHGFVRNSEFTLTRRDGSQINVIESSFATRDASGDTDRYQGVVLDITGKKKTETEIHRRNRELSALNTIAVSFNQSLELDEVLRTVLRQIVDLFGTDTAEIYLFENETGTFRKRAGFGHSTGKSDYRCLAISPDTLVKIRARHTEIIEDPAILGDLRSDSETSLSTVLWRKDEVVGLLSTAGRSPCVLAPEDERIMVALGRQLATSIDRIRLYEETKKAYEDLRHAQEQLLQSEKMSAVGRLISGVAHELNNPLTAISGYSQLLETETLDPHVHQFIRKLHKQTERAQRIVQNLLSFARQHKPQRIHVDLRRVMEDTIALRDYEIRTHGIVLEKIFDSELPLVVADPHQLEQVFLNIINNAVDAILETGRTGILRIRIFAKASDVICEFHDSGPGMSDPKHVFDPFYTTKGVGKGTGLGLSICYGIVKEHGGEIAAYNHAHGGAIVRMRLPAAVGDKPVSEGERIAARRESRMEGRVLLVDSEDILDFERDILATAGLEVVAVSSTSEAIELLKQDSYDIVLLDGASDSAVQRVIRWLSEERPQMAARTVLMLPPADSKGPRSFFNSDRILCFVKPFDASEVLTVLRRFLRASKVEIGS